MGDSHFSHFDWRSAKFPAPARMRVGLDLNTAAGAGAGAGYAGVRLLAPHLRPPVHRGGARAAQARHPLVEHLSEPAVELVVEDWVDAEVEPADGRDDGVYQRAHRLVYI